MKPKSKKSQTSTSKVVSLLLKKNTNLEKFLKSLNIKKKDLYTFTFTDYNFNLLQLAVYFKHFNIINNLNDDLRLLKFLNEKVENSLDSIWHIIIETNSIKIFEIFFKKIPIRNKNLFCNKIENQFFQIFFEIRCSEFLDEIFFFFLKMRDTDLNSKIEEHNFIVLNDFFNFLKNDSIEKNFFLKSIIYKEGQKYLKNSKLRDIKNMEQIDIFKKSIVLDKINSKNKIKSSESKTFLKKNILSEIEISLPPTIKINNLNSKIQQFSKEEKIEDNLKNQKLVDLKNIFLCNSEEEDFYKSENKKILFLKRENKKNFEKENNLNILIKNSKTNIVTFKCLSNNYFENKEILKKQISQECKNKRNSIDKKFIIKINKELSKLSKTKFFENTKILENNQNQINDLLNFKDESIEFQNENLHISSVSENFEEKENFDEDLIDSDIETSYLSNKEGKILLKTFFCNKFTENKKFDKNESLQYKWNNKKSLEFKTKFL